MKNIIGININIKSIALLIACFLLNIPTIFCQNLAYIRSSINAGMQQNISVINTNTNTLANTINLPSGVSGGNGIALNPAGNRAYFLGQLNKVYVLNTTNNTLIDSLVVGNNPQSLLVSPDGSKLYVATDFDLYVINTNNNTLTNVLTFNNNVIHTFTISPTGDKLYIATINNTGVAIDLRIINTNTNTTISNTTINLGLGNNFIEKINQINISPDGGYAYISFFYYDIIQDNYKLGLTLNSLGTQEAINITIPYFNNSTFSSNWFVSHALTPDGKFLYIAFNEYPNLIRYQITETDNVANTSVEIPIGTNPNGIALAEDKVYVANTGSNNVSVIGIPNNNLMATIPINSSPNAKGNALPLLYKPAVFVLNPIKIVALVPGGTPQETILTFSDNRVNVNPATTLSTASAVLPTLVTALNLTNNLQFSFSNTDFEISTDNIAWQNSLTLTPTNGAINQNIFLRLKAGLTHGTKTANLTLTGANTRILQLIGEVNLEPQTLSFTPPLTLPFGTPPINLTASASSGLTAITFTSSDPTVATVVGNTLNIINAGQVEITATQAGNSIYAPVSEIRNITVQPINQNLTFNDITAGNTAVFGATPITLIAFVDSGLPITFESSDTNIATIAGNTLTVIGAGTVTITALQAGTVSYLPVAISKTFQVMKAPQTITFNLGANANKVFGDAPFNISATSSSGLPITWSSANNNTISIASNTVTIIGVGIVGITATQAGNNNYLPAPNVVQFLLIAQAPQSITFDLGANAIKTFGDTPFNLSATGGASANPITFTSSNPNVATINGNTVTILNAGTTTITANQAANAFYLPATPVTATLVVNKANQTINFAAFASNPAFGSSVILNATSTSGLAISYATSNTSVATITNNTLQVVGVGNADITATQAGNNNYNPAIAVVRMLTTSQATQTITFNPITPRSFVNNNTFNLDAFSSSGLIISYASSNTNVAAVSDNVVTIKGAGTATITASQAGNNNFLPATNVSQNLIINKADQSIAFTPLTNVIYSPNLTINLMAITTAGLPVTFTSDNTSIGTINGNVLTVFSAGTLTIRANQVGNTNFNPAPEVTRTLIISKNSQTITFGALNPVTFGASAFDLNATTTSGLPITYTSANTNVATVAGNRVTVVATGSTTITATQAGDNNFNAAPNVANVLVVNKATQVINLSTISTKTITDPPLTLNATASSGLPISYTILTTPSTGVATLTGNTVSFQGVGIVNIIASQAGNNNYLAAPNVSRGFRVETTTALENLTQNIDLPIYPNPTNDGIFKIDITTLQIQACSIEIYDPEGKIVHTSFWQNHTQKYIELNIAHLPNSQYLCKISWDKNYILKKIIKL